MIGERTVSAAELEADVHSLNGRSVAVRTFVHDDYKRCAVAVIINDGRLVLELEPEDASRLATMLLTEAHRAADYTGWSTFLGRGLPGLRARPICPTCRAGATSDDLTYDDHLGRRHQGCSCPNGHVWEQVWPVPAQEA